MKKGLVIGKYYPFHKGHQYVIDTALKNSDHVTAIVTGKKGQIIPASTRAGWIKEIYPQIDVKLVYHNIPDDDDQAWAKNTTKWLGFKPDLVFTSENYGDNYSQLMGSKHIPVDIPRKVFPISGTKIRENPLEYFQFLHPVVRSFFTRRICILGAESTGTTTLATHLAKYYKTSWVPEFGRYYTQAKQASKYSKWVNSDFEYIAKMQNSWEDEMAKSANRILLCDTNSLVTYLWQEFFVGSGTEIVKSLFRKRHYSLYIVTDIDIPFVQDNVRVGKRRKWFHKKILSVLNANSYNHITASGSLKLRLEKSKEEIDKTLKSYKIDERIL